MQYYTFQNRKQFIYSGELHYFRIPKSMWEDRLQKCKQAFLNSIGSYVPWNWHEERPGKFNFKGDRNLEEWIKLACKSGLALIIKPGPHICAEWDSGGFPNWLISTGCQFRSLDPIYLKYCRRYLKKINGIISRHQTTRGGNIYLYQVDNEFFSEDEEGYLSTLEKITRKDGIKLPLIHNAGTFGIRGREITDCLNFYPPPWQINGSVYFDKLRRLLEKQPDAPRVTMELQGGMFSLFGLSFPTINGEIPPQWTDMLIKSVVAEGLNGLNFYMYHGGTNPGNWRAYNVTTTYDFSAAIREGGELSERYYVSRLLGGFFDSFGRDLLDAEPRKNHATSSSERIDVLARAGQKTAFLFPRNLGKHDVDFRISLPDPLTNKMMTIPEKGCFHLKSLSMAIVPVNLPLNRDADLFYSTFQLFHRFEQKQRTVLIIYGTENERGQVVLNLSKKAPVTGDMRSHSWMGAARLRLDIRIQKKPSFVMVNTGRPLLIVAVTAEMASHAWMMNYKREKLALLSDIYFMRTAKAKNDRLNVQIETKPDDKKPAFIITGHKPEKMSLNGKSVSFRFRQNYGVADFRLKKHAFPGFYLPLNAGWRSKPGSPEKEIDFDDSGWKPCALPNSLEKTGLFKNGCVWYRAKFNPGRLSDALYLSVKEFRDEASFYLNGKYIGTGINHFHKEVSAWIKPGENVLAVALESLGHANVAWATITGLISPPYLASKEKKIELVFWKRKITGEYLNNRVLENTPHEVKSNFDDSKWENCEVSKSYDSRLSQTAFLRRTYWYRTNVFIPVAAKKKMVTLDIDEAGDEIWVYVNGVFMGRRGARGAPFQGVAEYQNNFSFDITENVKFGGKNLLAIGVRHQCDSKGGLHRGARLSFHDLRLGNWKARAGLCGETMDWQNEKFDDSSWDLDKIYDYPGIVYYRKKVKLDLPAGFECPLRLTVKNLAAKTFLFFNGVLLGRYAAKGPQNDFYVYEDLIRKENVITLAVETKDKTVDLSGISISPYFMAKKEKITLLFGK